MTLVTAAILPALIVATAVGVLDALRTLRHNTYVHLSQYFWLYVAAPVVGLTAIAVPVAAVSGLIGFAMGSSAPYTAALSSGVLTTLLLTLEAGAWLTGTRSKMAEAHVSRRVSRRTTTFAAAVLVIALTTATAGVVYAPSYTSQPACCGFWEF